MQATAKDLRFHVKELLETVARGEEVVITYRGKACAKLIPIEENASEEKDSSADDELFGIWKNDLESQNVSEFVRSLRKGRFHAD